MYPFHERDKSKRTLEMMMNCFEMNGRNDDGPWTWTDCSQMLKTELEGNMVNTSEDDPPFPYVYFSVFHSISIFQTHFPDALWKTSLLKKHYANYKPLNKIAITEEISFLLGFSGWAMDWIAAWLVGWLNSINNRTGNLKVWLLCCLKEQNILEWFISVL